MTNKFLSSIGGASVAVILLSILGRGIGFIRESFFASKFGLSELYDLYLASSIIPLILNTSFLYLIQNYLVPKFTETRINNSSGLIKTVSNNLFLFILVSIIISIILLIFSEFIISNYLSFESFQNNLLALTIFRIMLITIPLSISSAVLTSYLNSKFNFNTPLLSQIILNIFIITTVILYVDKINIYSIPLGFVIGNFIQLLFLLYYSKIRIFSTLKSFREIKPFDGITSTILLIVIIETIGQLHILIDRFFIDKVNAGTISGLNYAFTIYMLPISIISLSFSSVLFTKLSEHISKKSNELFTNLIEKSIDISLALHIPIFFIFFVWGDVFISILFERGAFGKDDTTFTFEILKVLIFSIIFYSTFAITNKSLYSAGLLKQLIYIQLIGIIIKLLINFLFVDKYLHIALASGTTISYIVVSILSVLIIKNYYNEFNILKLLLLTFKYVLICLPVIIGVYYFFEMFPLKNTFMNILQVLISIVLYFFLIIILKLEVTVSLLQIIPGKTKNIILEYVQRK